MHKVQKCNVRAEIFSLLLLSFPLPGGCDTKGRASSSSYSCFTVGFSPTNLW
jgi:hypothetical protein